MTPEELRSIIAYLRKRVNLAGGETERPIVIAFLAPTVDEMIGEGMHPEGVKRLLQVPWWDEMVTDILETPDYCEPGDSPQEVLEYARDVISDYIRKRFPLSAEEERE
jgi:hypothetical protein